MIINLDMTDADFEGLTDTSSRLGPDMHWMDERFEVQGGPPHLSMFVPERELVGRYIYWLGDSYVSLMLAKAYLTAKGAEFFVLWDMAQHHDDGPFLGYAIVTAYETEMWAKIRERDSEPEPDLDAIYTRMVALHDEGIIRMIMRRDGYEVYQTMNHYGQPVEHSVNDDMLTRNLDLAERSARETGHRFPPEGKQTTLFVNRQLQYGDNRTPAERLLDAMIEQDQAK